MLETFFKSTDQQFLAKYSLQLQNINKFGDDFKSCTDQELKDRTSILKARLKNGEDKDSIKNEAFALVQNSRYRDLLNVPILYALIQSRKQQDILQ